ncbi:hypothetical protein [Xanthomarina gelatinilytica]|uniref:hypothetical protein n=1 Tax=Xanthomarina gelatinilytica TaxID=1137281 RepID=UPI003AA7F931
MRKNINYLITNQLEIKFGKKIFSNIQLFTIIGCFILSSCKTKPADEPTSIDSLTKVPLFKNSIVSTDIDFITDKDPNAFTYLQYIRQSKQEMPDRRNEQLMDENTYVFKAFFSDGNEVEIWVHSAFGSINKAKKYAQMLTGPLGKLPKFMRKKLLHVVIHKGDETAFSESEGHFFVLYSENMKTRISNHDLEETVFHESVHATLDSSYKNNKKWLKAQKDDNVFITKYGESKPNQEDFSETAIFAYTILKYQGRLSSEIEEWVLKNIPNRLSFFRDIFI